MYGKLAPLLQKRPEYVVLHVSANGFVTYLLMLKTYVEAVPGITVIISEPITRYDDNALSLSSSASRKLMSTYLISPV